MTIKTIKHRDEDELLVEFNDRIYYSGCRLANPKGLFEVLPRSGYSGDSEMEVMLLYHADGTLSGDDNDLEIPFDKDFPIPAKLLVKDKLFDLASFLAAEESVSERPLEQVLLEEARLEIVVDDPDSEHDDDNDEDEDEDDGDEPEPPNIIVRLVIGDFVTEIPDTDDLIEHLTIE